MNALKYHWCETSSLSQAVLKHDSGVQRFHLQEVYAREQPVLYPAKNEEIYGIVKFHIYQKIFMSCITFKKKTSTCRSQVGHMWVTSGLFCGSVNQMGQQVRPTVNPDV